MIIDGHVLVAIFNLATYPFHPIKLPIPSDIYHVTSTFLFSLGASKNAKFS